MSETAIESLFDPKIVYVSSGTTRQAVFKEVADDLVEKGYVKDNSVSYTHLTLPTNREV